ncbi:MAG TPA: hypothetical protein VMG09_01925 [Bacteroidota bacterium]|nr:hypothetical protein [Bacteroidota bacterium]
MSYRAVGWSFAVSLEQVFAAQLYMWHLKWRAACDSADLLTRDLPELESIARPSLLDQNPDLVGLLRTK